MDLMSIGNGLNIHTLHDGSADNETQVDELKHFT